MAVLLGMMTVVQRVFWMVDMREIQMVDTTGDW